MSAPQDANEAAEVRSDSTEGLDVYFPAQCGCGHLYLEKYMLKELNDKGEAGFCWCGFCRTRRGVKPTDHAR